MPTGIDAGVSPTAMRMRRLESAHLLRDIHHELRVEIENLCETITKDLESIREKYTEFEATIAIDFDQFGMTELIYRRARELKDFCALYRMKVRFFGDAAPLGDEAVVHCVSLAYRMMLFRLENEPAPDDTLFYAWRGHLELP